jgi:hypothetical protein
MSIISTRIVRDSADVDIAIVGAVGDKTLSEVIASPENHKDAKAFKVTAIFHSIESGVKLRLYWEGEDDHTLILPLEGRGILDLTRFGGLEDPRYPGWTGNIILVAEGMGHFALSLELSKQRI